MKSTSKCLKQPPWPPRSACSALSSWGRWKMSASAEQETIALEGLPDGLVLRPIDADDYRKGSSFPNGRELIIQSEGTCFCWKARSACGLNGHNYISWALKWNLPSSDGLSHSCRNAYYISHAIRMYQPLLSGYLELLGQLTTVGTISEPAFTGEDSFHLCTMCVCWMFVICMKLTRKLNLAI